MKKVILTVFTLLAIFVFIIINTDKLPKKEKLQAVASYSSVLDKGLVIRKWKRMKFGLFVHWGLYSIPAGIWKGEKIPNLAEHIQKYANIPSEEYAQLANKFNPKYFSADSIVQLAKYAGMQYVVFTAKHHDGFCMFDSQYTNFDIMDATSYKKDIVLEFAKSCKKYGLKLGLYYSGVDWHINNDSIYLDSKSNMLSVWSRISQSTEQYEVNQLTELLTKYGDIVEVFFDSGTPTLEQSKRFASTVYSLQPSCLTNGRIMNNQGDYITMEDNHVPFIPIDTIAWEVPSNLYHTWGYKSWIKKMPLDVNIKNQVRKFSKIVARGGNFLLNIGPMSNGKVSNYERNVLLGIGNWMSKYGESIHNVQNTPFTSLDFGECTVKDNFLYFFISNWPQNNVLTIPGLESDIQSIITLNNFEKDIPFNRVGKNIKLNLNSVKKDKYLTVLKVKINPPLKIYNPITLPNSKKDIILKGSDAVCKGRYGKESYCSISNDYYRQWDLLVPKTGSYLISISYKMNFDSKDFIFEVDGEKANITLNRSMNFGYKAVTKIKLYKSERITFMMKQGKSFVFSSDLSKYKNQDTKYKLMNINIDKIKLISIE